MRLTHIDGIRGFFLISMTMGHIAFFVRTEVGWLTHHSAGFVDAAQGFVTLSGIVVGLVFGKRMLRGSPLEMRSGVFKRMSHIWRYHLVLLCAITALATARPGSPFPMFAYQSETPVLALTLGATLLTGPIYIDILPMYLVFMAFTPAALHAMARGHWIIFAGSSVTAWMLGQTLWPDMILGWFADLTGLLAFDVPIGLYFNRLGWQILFFAGLAGGFRLAQGRLSLHLLSRPFGHFLAIASFALTVIFFAVPKVVAYGGLGAEANTELLAAFDRKNMTLLRVMTFAGHFYLVLWLLVAGRHSRMVWLRNISCAMDKFVTWRPLVFLGSHSLPVYGWHVLLCYGLGVFAADLLNQAPWYWREGSVILAASTLFVPAFLAGRKPWRTRPLRRETDA